MHGVVNYLLTIIIGDRVQTLFGFVTPDFRWRAFPGAVTCSTT
jgi:hypothetical protein